ncbi:hypothetical protein BYT27DRAFT_7113967 [Phlegmacium glaucopus]|nr:hypothetical protein BYT27DRAFT_7113967 [Phlegmacium glaucopus]
MRNLGNVMGYPGVFQGNLHPYPSKPVPTSMGVGFDRYRCGFCKNPRVYDPWMGMCPKPTGRILIIIILLFTGSKSTTGDLITLTSKSQDTRQTHVTGMG